MPTMNLSSNVQYTSASSTNPITYNFNSDIDYSTVLSGTIEIPAKSSAGFVVRIPSETALFESPYAQSEGTWQAQCRGLILVNRNASDIQLLIGSGESPILVDGGGAIDILAGPMPGPKPGPKPRFISNLQLAANGVLMITNPSDVALLASSIGFPFILGTTVADQKATPGYVDYWLFNNKATFPERVPFNPK